ncbi:MAG TPA: hypothetical protein QGF02_01830 [Candidatus Babeliales bacterium]|nr:hypothetical protein [Candidatus Babeliales bacterium]
MAYLDECYSQRLINNPYSEQDILYLHETFLTVGFHGISVPSFDFGRAIMRTFLKSLNCYSDVACLTSHTDPLGDGVTDLYSVLSSRGALDNEDRLKDFILEEFDYDFLWIEEKPEWIFQPWYMEFENALKELHIDKFMPVIIVRQS